MPNTAPPQNATSTTQMPAIRTFQMDGGSQGNLASSVNLFRGDVNLSQTLFTLPGRSAGNGLDVSASIQYQSNTFRDATTWNADAPTGILGLGWSMPLTYIEATPSASAVSDARQYTLFDNGAPNGLFRQSTIPLLFAMDSTLSSGLRDGASVPADIVAAFGSMGLALSTSATVSGSGPWTLEDDELQQVYTLEEGSDALNAYDGGEYYQLQNYQFWKVLYYPQYERWVIVSDQAIRRSFGGRGADTDQGYATAKGNSVRWSVWWKQNGEAAWTGPSEQIDGQAQVAEAWYLVEVSDRWGARTEYSYNAGTRVDGILPVVEQPVGKGGLPYTKAVYLASVTDAFGRTVSFNYGDKLWDPAKESPREYSDPHASPPTNDAGPYQDRYETRYLEEITVDAADGSRLYSFEFGYAPRPNVQGPESAVANVTNNTGQLAGDTYKRFLTSVVQFDSAGVASPGLSFSYDLAEDSKNGQPGALLSATYPDGGVVHYQYTKNDLPLTERSQTAARPSDVPEGATPRVFFGSDATVVTYYQQNSQELSFQVYSWVGSWLCWQISEDATVIDTKGLVLSSLQCMVENDFIALSFLRSNGDRAVYVFQRDAARPGQWGPATIDGKATACDSPSLTYTGTGLDVTFGGGSTFFVVSQMDANKDNGSYDRLTWRWSEQAWEKTTVKTDQYTWVSAAAEYFATLGRDGKLEVNYLDGLLAWQRSASTTVSGLVTSNVDNVQLVPGSALVAIANLTSSNSQRNVYTVSVVSWNADYTPVAQTFGPYTDVFGASNAAMGWMPTVVDDIMIATNGNLLRFDGSQWSQNTSLNIGNPPANTTQRFAYASGYAIQVVSPTSGVGAATAKVVGYDPAGGSPWTGPVPISESLSGNQLRDNWPSAGGDDWLVVGPYVWFRGTSTSWTSVVSSGATLDLSSSLSGAQTFNSESLVDESPGFLAFAVDSGSTQSLQAQTLKNGQADGDPVQFDGENIYVSSAGGAGGAGVSPQGPQIVVGFPDTVATFDDAQEIFLHRYAGQAVQGNFTHYAVTLVEMDDGFGDLLPTSFVPDLGSAGADPSGLVAKYFKNTAYPGTEDPKNVTNGWAVSKYLNGLKDQTGDNYYDMLDGMLVATETYVTGGTSPIASTAATYTVVEQVASSPTDASAPPIQLRGGWVTQTKKVTMKDGVKVTQETAYEPVTTGKYSYTGQPSSQTQSSYGGSGQKETFVDSTTFGVELVPELVAIHALTDTVQGTSTRSDHSGTLPLSSTATTYQSYPTALGDSVSAPAIEAAFALLETSDTSFPFDSYSPGDTPAGWQLSARTTARTPYGQEIENHDALGTPTATLYDANDEFAVARVAGGSAQGSAYTGFEAYENLSPWSLTRVTFDADDAYTGTRSAVLPGGAVASVSTTVAPPKAGTTYLLGCRFRTPTGFKSDGSGPSATVTVDGKPQAPVTLAWTATNDEWTYVTLPIAIPASSSNTPSVSLVAHLTNTTSFDIHVDTVLVAPLHSGTTARTFDVPSQQVLSTMDAGGRTSRTYYDLAYRPTLSVGASGLVRELSQSFSSRLGQANDSFSAASPNAELTLHPASGGILETFRDGGNWTKRWAAKPSGAFSVSDGALSYDGSQAATLSWLGDPGSSSFALYFEPQSGANARVGVTAGDISIEWSGSGYLGSQAGSSWTALAAPPLIASHWLLVVGQGVVLFFADGQLIFSEETSPASPSLGISLAGASVQLRNLTVVENVRLGLSYNDAATRQRQVHQLHGADSLLCELVYDALGRQVATSKNAPGSFGKGASASIMAYRESFLDVKAFLQATSSDWKMSGDVADYYKGQTDGGVTRSDDEKYPYWGTRYESSPRSVKIETSQPGKAYAIDLSVNASERQTVQYAYGANDGSDPSLKAGEYTQASITSAVKTVANSLTDKLGQTVAKVSSASDGSTVGQSAGVRGYEAPSSGPTASLVTQLPNALLSGPQSGDAEYVRTTVANAIQDTVSLTDADTGQSQFINDAAGNLRFVQPQLASGQSWFIYYKYDALGRMVEEGKLSQAWDPTTLEEHANDPSWPSDGNAVVRIEYDGDGTDPSLIGMKWKATTTNAEPSSTPHTGGGLTVVEEFAYDPFGNIRAVTQTMSGAVSASATIGYSYNTLSEVLEVSLPEDAPVQKVYYRYDDQGDVSSVGTSDGGGEYGVFTYNAERQPSIQTLDGGDWVQTVTYASPGWTQTLAVASSDGGQTLNSTYGYDADGLMNARDIEFAFTGYSESCSDTIGYTPARFIESASGTSNVEYSSYDPNGNLWALSEKGEATTFTSAKGANYLASATIAGGTPQAFVYDAQGRMTSGLGRSLEYDDTTGMTTAVVSGSTAMRLGYGSAQQRVTKQVGSTEKVYFCGAGQVPVLERVDGVWRVNVHGPTGLLVVVADQNYFPLADITSSVWAVVSGGKLISAQSYLPFGKTQGTSLNPGVIAFGYQGQEYDSEVGLYNFRARLYDPVLRRFLAPDPRREFASPYVFAGNDPLTVSDPTGEISVWAQVGIGAALVAITAIGIGLSFVTFGAAAAPTAAADAAVAGAAEGAVIGADAAATAAAAGAEAGAAAGAEAGAAGAAAGAEAGAAGAEAGAAAGAEGTAAAGAGASAEVTAGATTGEAASSSFTWSGYAVNTLSSTLTSAGTSGLQYDIQHGRDFTAKGFFEAVGIGAASGFASGAVGGALQPFAEGLTAGMSGARAVAAQAAVGAAKGAITGAISSDVKTILTNVSQHQPWYQGLLKATLTGAAKSAATGAATSLGKSAWAARETLGAKAAAKGIISDATAQKINTLPEIAKAAAKSDAAIASYIVAGFFLPAGYIVWGVAQSGN